VMLIGERERSKERMRWGELLEERGREGHTSVDRITEEMIAVGLGSNNSCCDWP
jgi:hypothetical protein